MSAEVFKNGREFGAIIQFFEDKGFVRKTSDYVPEYLEEKKYTYFEVSDDGTILSVIEYAPEDDIKSYEKELKNLFMEYMLLVRNDLSEYRFYKYDAGTDKILRLKKKREDLEHVFLKKLDALEYNNIESIEQLFDRSEFIKEFYQLYCDAENYLFRKINGISDDHERDVFTKVMLQRMMFLWFLQKKKLLDNNESYFVEKFREVTRDGSNFYKDFLEKLFFNGLCVKQEERSKEINELIGDVPYLNGGLFIESEVELKYEDNIEIPNDAFYRVMSYPILKGERNIPVLNLLECKEWTVDERSGEVDKLNPEILGYIFEKSINKKDLGAVYTPEEITTYIARNTIHPYLLDRVNEKFSKDYEDLNKIFEGDNKEHLRYLFEVLKNIKILDPAVGSGHFLVDAMVTLERIYHKLRDKEILGWSNYQIREHIIVNNLFGVDILEGAVEICKLRLFLALSETFRTKEDVQPLPNIDFNIRSGNSLIGLTSTDELKQNFFGKGDASETLAKNMIFLEEQVPDIANKAKKLISKFEINPMDLFRLRTDLVKRYRVLHDKEVQTEMRRVLKEITYSFNNELNEQYYCRFEKCDSKKFDKEKYQKFLELKPFHWIMEYSEIFERGGFNIIVENPPYKTKNISDLERKFYKLLYKNILTGRLNLYSMFISRTTNLLNNNGIHGFITANSLITDDFTKKLRYFIIKNLKIIEIVDLMDRRGVFEEILQGTCLLFVKKLQKENNDYTTKICRTFNPITLKSNICEIGNVQARELFNEDRNVLHSKPWVVSPYKTAYNIIKKLFKNRTLDYYGFKVQSGEIRQADNNVKPYLIKYYDAEDNTFPVVRGRNIRMFCLDLSYERRDGWWYKRPNKIEERLHRDYVGASPRIVLQRITAREQVQRLICAKISQNDIEKNIRVYLENSANYILMSDEFIKDEDIIYYIVGLLNSTLINWYFDYINLTASVTPSDVEKLPIVLPPEYNKENYPIINNISALSREIEKMMKNESCNTEHLSKNEYLLNLYKKLNKYIYKLYGLNDVEKKFVEDEFTFLLSSFHDNKYSTDIKSMMKWKM